MRPHGIVEGFRSEDQRRYRKIPAADIRLGRCVSCRAEVYGNIFAVSALRERDADPICANCYACEARDVTRDLISS